MAADRESRLGRWSRRKAEARAGQSDKPAEEASIVPAADPPTPAAEHAADAGADIAEPLPKIEDLDGESDYRPFLRDGVPEHLRRLALRKLWLSDPVLANVDGLVDYGEDFSVAETMGDAVRSIYQVGKGMVEDAESEAEAEAETTAETKAQVPGPGRPQAGADAAATPSAGRIAQAEDPDDAS